jgi:uncharacterized protein YcbX
MRIASLYRYPVKGLTPERLPRAALEEGRYFPGDRLFAIENGPSGFDPAAPVHQPKIKYLMLMRNEALARLRTRYDDASGDLVVAHEGSEALRASTATEAGREQISRFFEGFMPDELRGKPQLLRAPDSYRFTDSRSGFVSIINLASVAALEERIGAPVDPLGGERARRQRARDTIWPATTRDQAHRALCGDQCRSADRRPRHADPQGADAGLWPCRLRNLLPDPRKWHALRRRKP